MDNVGIRINIYGPSCSYLRWRLGDSWLSEQKDWFIWEGPSEREQYI